VLLIFVVILAEFFFLRHTQFWWTLRNLWKFSVYWITRNC